MKQLLALCALVLSFAAAAADRTYAIMSVMGDGMLVARHGAATGSSIAHDDRNLIKMPGPVLDRTAVLAVDDALRKVVPDARPILLQGREAAVLDAQQRTLGEPDATQAIADALRGRLPQMPATHILLIARQRAPARFALDDGTAGEGAIEGAGFYVDPGLDVKRDNGQRGTGFMAAFAWLTVALVDVKTGKVLAEEPVRAWSVEVQGNSVTNDPWEALEPAQKVRALQHVIREVGKVVPALLAKG